MSDFKISVLDQTPVPEGLTGGDALRNTIDLAKTADKLGYHRYWLAEHHGLSLAGPAPEVLAGPVAAATTRIRVGSGGVMLPHYSPFKVAESFSLLAGLFPGRIDLAIGRASGTEPITQFALQRDRRQAAADDFPQQMLELLAYFREELPKDHPFWKLQFALPGGDQKPEIWLLGSSQQSAIWAKELGLPYAFADFINSDGAPIALSYRGGFEPSKELTAPHSMVGLWVLAAETTEEARELAASIQMSMLMLRRGTPIKIPPMAEAVEFLRSQGREPGVSNSRRIILGDPESVRTGIEQAVEEYRADEAILVTITHDHDARKRSYELVAKEFGLA
ncbi:MAG: LLM class flavin-dependent oxidoreductase [Solirubrobacterales bacterium]|nr:LLM class flavin-dependent oxidoreductase [Solirubrobacterales bacterium]